MRERSHLELSVQSRGVAVDVAPLTCRDTSTRPGLFGLTIPVSVGAKKKGPMTYAPGVPSSKGQHKSR